ncbi:MAG: serine/threonine protein kinase [Candidatus Eremiobacteraeota bacterium]|nr:serine/threonine protein kinase [Candidatus Eremiobacteraeota bacterium]
MAVVYKVWQPELERWVAVKKCKNPQDIPAFHKEAKLMAALKHPALAQIHALQHDELTMEFIEGDTLRNTTIDSNRLLEQLLDVLEYLHGEDVILKDLKPENIMILPNQTVKVLDLGIAKRIHEGTQLLLKGVGSEFYAPPEQYGHGTTDQRSDFYSLGATLYFCETREDPPPAWERLSKGTPLKTNNPLIEKLTQLKAQDRPENVQAIRQFLRPIPKKERPRPAEVSLRRTGSFPQSGLLAWNDEGLWVANQSLTNLHTRESFGKNLQPVRLVGSGQRLALACKDQLVVKDRGQWTQQKLKLKDLALFPQDLLLLSNHLVLREAGRRFATGWGRRYLLCAADDTRVAAGGPALKVWDRGGAPLWESSEACHALTFHGPFLFAVQKTGVVLLQAETGQRLTQIHTGPTKQIHLSDRHLIAIHDQQVSLWDYRQGQQLLQVDLPAPILSSALKDELAVSTADKIYLLQVE